MAKRKKKTPSPKIVPFDSSIPADSFSSMPPGMESESVLAAFKEMIQGQVDLSNCESFEEAKAMLGEFLEGKTIDDLVPGLKTPDTPHYRAIEMLDAIDWDGDRLKIEEMINEALEIDPHSCDAFLHLSNLSEDQEEARSYLEKAVEVGEKKHADLIAEAKENDLPLWGFPESRPFLRVMFDLGSAQQWFGDFDLARATFERLLELNPIDSQGVRERLVNLYVILRDWKSGKKLIERFEDDPGCWHAYSKALFCFMEASESPNFKVDATTLFPFDKNSDPQYTEAARALKDAVIEWPWVPSFLIDYRVTLVQHSGYYDLGDPDEAFAYSQSAFVPWSQDPLRALWLMSEVRRWMRAPKFRKKVKQYRSDYSELLDLIESADIRETGWDIEGEDAGAYEHFSRLIEVAEQIANELMER